MAVQSKGILRPNEKHSIRIRIQAEQNPCIVKNVVLCCEVFDLKQRRNYENSIGEFNWNKKSEEEFIITDDDIIRLVSNLFNL